MARAAISRMLNPEPDNTVIAKENVAYSFSSESYAIGENGTLTISTEHGVAGVTVNGAEVVSCEAVENGEISRIRHENYISLYNQAKEIKEWELKEDV